MIDAKIRHLDAAFEPKAIDAIFSALDQGQCAGAAVGVAIRGEPVYRKGFGLAHMELPVALSSTIRMRIGSVTKHFTCLAYLLLCEASQADLDDPVGRYLPELHPSCHAVTIRQLMGHLSGLFDIHDVCFQFSGLGRAVSSDELLRRYRTLGQVNAAPGTRWLYNNGAYLILSAVIERVTAQSLEDVFRTRIFEPAGLHDTLLRRWDSDFVPNSATLHLPTTDGRFSKIYMGTALAGEGGVVSTIDDMLRWLAQMDAPIVGSAATWAAMKTPLTLPNGVSTGYGLGLMTETYRGAELLHHSGGVLAGNSEMLKVPAANLDVVVIANRGDVWAPLLARQVLDACLPGLAPIETRDTPLRPRGVFRSAMTGRVLQLLDTEAGADASIDGLDLSVETDSQGVLRPAGIVSYLRQALTMIGDPDAPHSVSLDDYGEVDELVRQPPSLARAVDVCGRYRCDVIDTLATIEEEKDGVVLRAEGWFGAVDYALEPIAERLWRARSSPVPFFGGVLTLGEADFQFSTNRTLGLRFRRLP